MLALNFADENFASEEKEEDETGPVSHEAGSVSQEAPGSVSQEAPGSVSQEAPRSVSQEAGSVSQGAVKDTQRDIFK